MTLDEQAREDGLAYRMTWQRGRPCVVEVCDGGPRGRVLARRGCRPGEHPHALLERALVAARRARLTLVEGG